MLEQAGDPKLGHQVAVPTSNSNKQRVLLLFFWSHKTHIQPTRHRCGSSSCELKTFPGTDAKEPGHQTFEIYLEWLEWTFLWENDPIAAMVPKSVSWKMTRHLDARNRLLKKREWSAQCCPWCLGCRVWINWRLPADVVLSTCFTPFSFHSVRPHPASFSWETPGAGQVSPSCLLRAAPANRSLSSVVVGKVRMQWFLSKTSVDLHAVLWGLSPCPCVCHLWDVQGTGQCELPVLEGWGGRMPEKNKSTTCVEGRLGKAGKHDFEQHVQNGSLQIFSQHSCLEGLELEDPYSHLATHSSCNSWTTYLLEPLCLGLGTWHNGITCWPFWNLFTELPAYFRIHDTEGKQGLLLNFQFLRKMSQQGVQKSFSMLQMLRVYRTVAEFKSY